MINLIGKKFGRLTPLKVNGKSSHRGILWFCQCDCGKKTIVIASSLISGNTKSCGCLKKVCHGIKLPYGKSMMRQTLSNYRLRAKRTGLFFKLTEEQFEKITKENCFYCGEVPNGIAKARRSRNNGDYVYNGIDRVNNSKGYTVDNIVPCCKQCNMAKSDKNQKDFLLWIKKIYGYSFKLDA